MSVTRESLDALVKTLHPPRLIGVALLSAALSCTGLRHPMAQEDVSRAVGPPPPEWQAAIAFRIGDSTRVEFFDGERSRVVTSSDRIEAAFGRSAWFRVRPRDTFSTVLLVTVTYPGQGVTTAEYPLTIQRDAYYEVSVIRLAYSPRSTMIGAQEVRSYAVPPSVQQMPGDSLWIFWGARSRRCWSCPN
jgi:hypothetical protein